MTSQTVPRGQCCIVSVTGFSPPSCQVFFIVLNARPVFCVRVYLLMEERQCRWENFVIFLSCTLVNQQNLLSRRGKYKRGIIRTLEVQYRVFEYFKRQCLLIQHTSFRTTGSHESRTVSPHSKRVKDESDEINRQPSLLLSAKSHGRSRD